MEETKETINYEKEDHSIHLEYSEVISKKTIVILDEGQKNRYSIHQNIFRIGRDNENNLCTNQAQSRISSRHCEIMVCDNYALILDNSSLNGTFVKIPPLQPFRIRKNFIFEIGVNLYSIEKNEGKIHMRWVDGLNKGKIICDLDNKNKFYILTRLKSQGPNHIFLDDASVDNDHAMILLKENKLYMMALESNSGYFIKIFPIFSLKS